MGSRFMDEMDGACGFVLGAAMAAIVVAKVIAEAVIVWTIAALPVAALIYLGYAAG